MEDTKVKKPVQADKKPEKAADKKPEKAADKKPEKAADKKPEKAADKKPEKAADKKPEKAADKKPEKAADKKPAQAAGKKPAQAAGKKAAGKKPAQAAGKKPAQAAGKKPAQAADKRPVQAASKRPVQAASKRPVQAASKKPVQAVGKKFFKIGKKPGKKPVKPGKKSVKGGRVRYGKIALKPNTFIEKPIGGEKNGGTRLVRVKKLPAYYATQLNPKKRAKRIKSSKRPLRASITPGTICILLAGIHKGKKVVFLKELGGGLCLVTGPFKINACPLRRVNQIFLIATSTKLDISSFGIPKHINDKYFRRVKASRPKKEEGDIFERKQEKYVPSDQRKKDQAVVDGMVISAIKKRGDKKMLFGYLGTMFGLKKKMYPHRMIF